VVFSEERIARLGERIIPRRERRGGGSFGSLNGITPAAAEQHNLKQASG
jgi:hypothetical protein